MKKPSANFSYSEFFRPSSGKIIQLDYMKIDTICENILQPVSDNFPNDDNNGNKLIRINSAKRSPEHNRNVGGSKTSDHLYLGRCAAVDFSYCQNDLEFNKRAFHFIKHNCLGKFGQMIGYYVGNLMIFIHISLPSPKHDGSANDINRILITQYKSGVYEPISMT